MLVRCSVQDIESILLQHHISRASILFLSLSLTVQISTPYNKMGNTSALTNWSDIVVFRFFDSLSMVFGVLQIQKIFNQYKEVKGAYASKELLINQHLFLSKTILVLISKTAPADGSALASNGYAATSASGALEFNSTHDGHATSDGGDTDHGQLASHADVTNANTAIAAAAFIAKSTRGNGGASQRCRNSIVNASLS